MNLPGLQRSAAPYWIFASVALLWLWGLGDHGMASLSELPLVFRAQALLGSQEQELLRAPLLPDALRAASLSLDGPQLDASSTRHLLLRLPGYLAALALLALCGLWAKLRGQSPSVAMLIAAALPALGIGARHLLPELWTELALSLWMWSIHSKRLGRWPRLILQGLSLALLLHCAGLAWGLSVALLLVALQQPGRGWKVAAVASLLASLVLVGQLQEGYQPLLAAARDPLTLYELPTRSFSRGLMTLLSNFGLWSPLLAYAWLRAEPRAQIERQWLLLLVFLQLLSSIFFEAAPLIGLVPASSLLLRCWENPGEMRKDRAPWLWSAVGMALLLSTLAHYPHQLLWPQLSAAEFTPDPWRSPPSLLAYWRVEALILIFLLLVWSYLRRPHWALLPLAALIAGRAQLYSPALAEYSSPRSIAEQSRQLAPSASIASFGLQDPGWKIYADPAWPALKSMREAVEHCAQTPSALLLSNRKNEARLSGELSKIKVPLQMRDAGHPQLRLFLNRPHDIYSYPAQALRHDQLPAVQHRCRVIFAKALELQGWSLEPSLRRGASAQLRLFFRVLAPLRGPAQFIAQIEQSPWGVLPQNAPTLQELEFPVSQWPVGSIVELRQSIQVPWIWMTPGEHELSLGLARSSYSYEKITFPTDEDLSASGLSWIGTGRRRIVLGRVPLSNL